jgi:hypothetical protein
LSWHATTPIRSSRASSGAENAVSKAPHFRLVAVVRRSRHRPPRLGFVDALIELQAGERGPTRCALPGSRGRPPVCGSAEWWPHVVGRRHVTGKDVKAVLAARPEVVCDRVPRDLTAAARRTGGVDLNALDVEKLLGRVGEDQAFNAQRRWRRARRPPPAQASSAPCQPVPRH